MLAEQVASEPSVSLQSRPGVGESGTELDGGPIRGVYTADGVLNNGLFAVSDGDLYSGATLVGAIDGTGPVSFAGYEDYVFVNAGESIWGYDGTTYVDLTFPDDADVIKIVVGASRLIAVRKDTGKFYWTDPLDIAIDALSFATAENSPDTLKDALYLGDKLVLFGAETVEFWPASDDADLPFTPLPGATLPVGIKDTGLCALFNRTYAWITNFNEVCVGAPDNIVSEPELQVQIREASELSLFTFYVDDNEYLAIRLPTETWVYGARTGTWSKFTTGNGNWIAQYYDGGHFGSAEDGKLLVWSEDFTDVGDEFERRFRAWIPLTGETLTVANIMLRTNAGNTTFLTGEYANPIVELRTSKDGGHEWHPWKQRSLGVSGQYRLQVMWSSMGKFNYPGVLAEVRVTDPVDVRFSGMAYNVPFGG
jgi:hypothetical protein